MNNILIDLFIIKDVSAIALDINKAPRVGFGSMGSPAVLQDFHDCTSFDFPSVASLDICLSNVGNYRARMLSDKCSIIANR